MRKRRKGTLNDRERERERARETGIFSMMGFDSATSFLALLVNKSYRKRQKSFHLRSKKKIQNHFLSRKFCKVTDLGDLKSFVGQKWSLNSEF